MNLHIFQARIHPLSIYMAYETYRKGHGDKGKLKWTPVERYKWKFYKFIKIFLNF